jgi:protein gp37
MKQAHRFPVRQGLTQHTAGGMVWTGEVRFNDKVLLDPLRWQRPRKIFVCAHGDLFHESVPFEWIDRVFAVMALASHHVFQVLTKRPERMRDYVSADRRDEMNSHAGTMMHWDDMPSPNWPLPNVWLGTSVEDQPRADERIPVLLNTPAAVRWLSGEPLLGPVNLTAIDINGDAEMDALNVRDWATEVEDWRDSSDTWEDDFEDWYGCYPDKVSGPMHPTIDWVVVGGESGPGARPMHPDWARSLRDQCAAAGVPFLFKQWGEFAPGDHGKSKSDDCRFLGSSGTNLGCDRGAWGQMGDLTMVQRVGKARAGRLLDGVEHNGYPA